MMTDEQRDEAEQFEYDNRQFAAAMETIISELEHCDHHTRTGNAHRIIEAAQTAAQHWEMLG